MPSWFCVLISTNLPMNYMRPQKPFHEMPSANQNKIWIFIGNTNPYLWECLYRVYWWPGTDKQLPLSWEDHESCSVKHGNFHCISMAYHTTAVAPLLMQWRYCSLVLSHRYNIKVYWFSSACMSVPSPICRVSHDWRLCLQHIPAQSWSHRYGHYKHR